MRPYHLLLLPLLLLLPVSATPVVSCRTVASLIREQFDRFITLQRRGPPHNFLMPFYTAYISALDAFIADRAFCPQSFGPCCLEQREVDNFHAIYDRSLVDSKIAALRNLDTHLFYLPEDAVSNDELPPLTDAQQNEIDIMWRVTQEALENRPDSYVAVWSVLPEGLNMLYDPRRSEACSEFEKYKAGANSGHLVTSVQMVHYVTGMAMHGRLLGVSEDNAVQIVFHAAAFIFNGIRCEKKQNEELLVPTFFYPFYASTMNKYIAAVGQTKTAIPEIPRDLINRYLGDSLRVLSSYKSWGRIEHLVSNGVTTDKRNMKEDIFSSTMISKVLGYMLEHTTMTEAQRSNIQVRKHEADADVMLQLSHHRGQWRMPMVTISSSSLELAYRQTVECTESLFHAYPVDPATALSGCCADLCDNTVALNTLDPVLTKSECCVYCNEASCDVEDNPSNPLSELDEVHLIPYYSGGSEVVNV